jgi:hypothetical protein
MQDVGIVGRFQSAPRETHLKVVKIIFRYFKGTLEFGLWYPKEKLFSLNGYTNVDLVGSICRRYHICEKSYYNEWKLCN